MFDKYFVLYGICYRSEIFLMDWTKKNRSSPGLMCLGSLSVIAVLVMARDIFFGLIFITWILRNLYLIKKTVEQRNYSRNFTYKEPYGNEKRKKREIFNEKDDERKYRNNELKEILTEIGNLQRDTFENLTKELRELANEKVENIAKIREFSGRDNEEPTEWIKEFNRVAEANNWKNERRIVIAAVHLREIAMEWYEQDKRNIQRWNTQGNNDSFEERFVERFTTIMRKNKWMDEVVKLKQEKGETINAYEIRFKTLARKIKNEITELEKMTRFIRGLLPEIYSLTVLGEQDTLDNVIENAKKAEISVTHQRKNLELETIKMNERDVRMDKKKRKQKCYKCGKKGHLFAECKEKN